MPGDDPNASSMPAFFDQLGRRVGRRIRMRIGVNRRLFFLMTRHKSHEEEPLGWSVGDFALSDPGCRLYIDMARNAYGKLDPKLVSCRIHYRLQCLNLSPRKKGQ